MKFLLDTDACISYLRHRDSRVAARLAVMPNAEIALCSVVKAELFYGALRTSDPATEQARLRAFLAGFVSLPFDDRAAETYGRIRAQLSSQGAPIGPNDLMIAAIALAQSLTLITHNTREFSRVKGLVIDDWEAPAD